MMTSLEQDDEKTPSKFKHLDDETLNKRFGISRETYQKIEDEAFARLRDGMSIMDVAKVLKIAGFTSQEITRAFDAMAADGYSFIPEIRKFARNDIKREYPIETNVDQKRMDGFIRYHAWKQQRDILREESPVLSQIFPGTMQGLRVDAQHGRYLDEGARMVPMDFRRLGVDMVTSPFRLGEKVFGDAIDKSKYPSLYANPETRKYIPGRWQGQDMDDPAGAMNDVWMGTAFLNPGQLVRKGGALVLGKTAVPRIAGRALQALGARATKYVPSLGRFLTDVGVEAAGSYGASRISDFTEPYELPIATAGAGVGVGVQYGLQNSPRVPAWARALRTKSTEKIGAAKERFLPAIYGAHSVPAVPARVPDVFGTRRSVIGITSEGAPSGALVVSVPRPAGRSGVPSTGSQAVGGAAGRTAGTNGEVFAQNITDPTLYYLIKRLGMSPEEIPGSVLNTHGGESVIGALERTIGSSAHGEPFLARHAGFKDRLNKRAGEALREPVNGRIPNTDPTDAIDALRAHWQEIKDKAFEGHFNFANKFEGDLAESLSAADEVAYAKLLEMAEDGVDVSAELAKYATPRRTKDLLKSRRGQLNAKQAGWENVDDFRKLGQDESKLIDQVEEALGDDDFSPLRRLRQLAYGVQNINDYLYTKSAEKKLLNSSEKFLQSLKQRMKADMEDILTSGWFGEAGEAAVKPWRESAEKAAKFLDGERALAPYLNPQTIDAKGLVNRLKGGKDFSRKVRAALDMGGEFGKNSLDDLKRIQLMNSITLDKDGIAGTTSLKNLENNLGAISELFDKGDPLLGEYIAILTALSRAGSPIEAGSAAGRNMLAEFVFGEPSHWWKMRKLNAAREDALVREGVIPPKRSSKADAIGTPSSGAKAAEEPMPGPLTPEPELPGERVPAPPERTRTDVVEVQAEPVEQVPGAATDAGGQVPALPPATAPKTGRLKALATTATTGSARTEAENVARRSRIMRVAANKATSIFANKMSTEELQKLNEDDRWLAEHYGWKPRGYFDRD